jgi:hypothetical protein
MIAIIKKIIIAIIGDDIILIKKKIQEQEIEILILIITNDNIPIHQRRDAYAKYKQLGGNSWIDDYIKNGWDCEFFKKYIMEK